MSKINLFPRYEKNPQELWNISIFSEVVAQYKKLIATGKLYDICISLTNSKLGDILSFSVMPLVTCNASADCAENCYIKFLSRDRIIGTWQSYARNTAILETQPDKAYHAISAKVANVLYFRWNVAGDFYNDKYMQMAIKIAKENKHCHFFAYSRQFDIMAKYGEKLLKLKNFTIRLSFADETEKEKIIMDYPILGLFPVAVAETDKTPCNCPNQKDKSIKCLHCKKCILTQNDIYWKWIINGKKDEKK